MPFLNWVYISQNFAQSHDCMTVTFRSSAFHEHFRCCLSDSVIIKVAALLIKAFEVHINVFKGSNNIVPTRFNIKGQRLSVSPISQII